MLRRLRGSADRTTLEATSSAGAPGGGVTSRAPGGAFPSAHQLEVAARGRAELHLRIPARRAGPGDQPE
jgi:hypothetical protein